MPDLQKQISELMLSNRRTVGSHQYTVPSPDTYPYQWLWDSCFHTLILSHFDIPSAKKELISLVSKQFKDGMIPHMIYWEKTIETTFPQIKWGKEDTSSITQPPMLPYAVWKIYSQDHDIHFLKTMYPSMKNFFDHLLKNRDPRGNHLMGIINPDESGEDNSSRFDSPLGLDNRHSLDENYQKRIQLVAKNLECSFDAPYCMKNFFWVKDVPFNAIMVENLIILSQIAVEVAEDKDSNYFYQQALLIKQAMRKFMLEDGIFWSTEGKNYEKIKVKTWAIFSPLFGRIVTQKEAKNLVDNYLLNKKEFSLPFLVPTVSFADPSFDPNGFWRGPVWMATNWFIYKGLLNYGFEKEADLIYQSSLSLIEKSGFREQYDPLTGEGYGARDFTWGGLILDMTN